MSDCNLEELGAPVELTLEVHNCARCGGDHFVEFQLMSMEVVPDLPEKYWGRYKGVCPETGKVITARFERELEEESD